MARAARRELTTNSIYPCAESMKFVADEIANWIKERQIARMGEDEFRKYHAISVRSMELQEKGLSLEEARKIATKEYKESQGS